MPRLAVLAPSIGTVSETFIARHMADLLPGDTAVVANVQVPGSPAPPCPRLLLGMPQREERWSVFRRSSGARSNATRAARAAAFLREHDVDVAMGEYLTYSHQWLPVTRELGIRFFAHAHGYDVSRKLRDADWRARYLDYNLADGVITVSEASRQRLIDLGMRPDKVHVIACGVDVPLEPLVRPAREMVRCLAVGRMVPKKGPLLTLEAFRLAAARHEGLHLDFIGEGELLPAAEQYVRDANLGARVRLHGAQPHDVVSRAIREADVFVQHSRTDPVTGDEEGLPVAILEAMAHALPVVSTRHAGIPEAVIDGVTGMLVAEGDATQMAACLVALGTDPGARARLGTAGWQRARDRFSWAREREALLELLGLTACATRGAPHRTRGSVAIPGDPLVTVVVPAFNRAATLERCLHSVQAQSYPRWETVVVDDGSTDGTAEVAGRIARQDARVRVVRHTGRRGAQAARNSGIHAARGEWIAFLDSDDEFLPRSLELRLHRAIETRTEVVHSACQVRYADGAVRPYHVPRLTGRVYATLLKREGPVFPALLVKRSALERIGYLDERVIAFQEWDTAIRLARHYEFAFEPEPTFIYNCDGADAMSKDLRRNGRAYQQVVRKHFAAMLRHGGPGAMAEHCRRAERWYDSAAAPDLAKRCRRQARLWSCLNPTAVWGKMRASLIRPA